MFRKVVAEIENEIKRKKAFCEVCREDVFYTIEVQKLTATLKGQTYKYNGENAYCKSCGSEVYLAELNDSNLKSLYDVYRKEHGIISLEKILEIPHKYSIGKRPLSLLLGWGEQTFSRYCDGDIPSKQYSDILQQIYSDANYYAKLLENNRSNLTTDTTYTKSKAATDEILKTISSENSKIDAIISYLLSKCEDVTPLALQKTLYYIQGFFYAFYDTFIFSEDCEAWVHGPVYKDVYNRYKCYQCLPIDNSGDADGSNFSTSEKSILDSVVKNLGCYSGKVLENFTHAEKPWLVARGDLSANMPSNEIISKDLIGEYLVSQIEHLKKENQKYVF